MIDFNGNILSSSDVDDVYKVTRGLYCTPRLSSISACTLALLPLYEAIFGLGSQIYVSLTSVKPLIYNSELSKFTKVAVYSAQTRKQLICTTNSGCC